MTIIRQVQQCERVFIQKENLTREQKSIEMQSFCTIKRSNTRKMIPFPIPRGIFPLSRSIIIVFSLIMLTKETKHLQSGWNTVYFCLISSFEAFLIYSRLPEMPPFLLSFLCTCFTLSKFSSFFPLSLYDFLSKKEIFVFTKPL